MAIRGSVSPEIEMSLLPQQVRQALRENDISYKSGLLFFTMTSIPLNRLQHCEVSQGPLGRLFDLASVKIYTAGGSTSDLSIGGLKKEAAHRLRDHITRLSAQYE